MNWRGELFLWVIALGGAVTFAWNESRREYMIPLTPNSVLYCQGKRCDVLIDTLPRVGVVSPRRGGTVFVSDVSKYGFNGDKVYGKGNPQPAANGGQWFVLNTVEPYDVTLFATESDLLAALRRGGVAPTLLAPDFAQADWGSIGPAPRLALVVAGGMLTVIAIRARHWTRGMALRTGG